MLLTLNAVSLHHTLDLSEAPSSSGLLDLPELALQRLLMRGLVVDTVMLKGWNLDDLVIFRNRADQAGCPCLVLRESDSINAHTTDSAMVEASSSRLGLIARAAQRLGCNALALHLDPIRGEEQLDRAAAYLRSLMEQIDRLELNLMIEPGDSGDLADPEILIRLIKQVGGFRIGTMPSFKHALASGNPEQTLRQIAPYAGAVLASCGIGHTKKSKGSFTSEEKEAVKICLESLQKVGYGQILAMDYLGDGDPMQIIEDLRSYIEDLLPAGKK